MRGDKEITNSADVIDSRDIIERIKYLEIDEENGTDEDKAELKALKELAEEAEGYCGDWKYGATLIRDSYFEEYAEQLAEDIGAIQKGASWPNTCIDWEKAADELKQDYTCVDFDGVDYWVR